MNPQDRIIKKMIDNIVESNKPSFEKSTESNSSSSDSSNSNSSVTSGHSSEDAGILGRKIEYGFNQNRQEHADLRKLIEELSGQVKLLRGDMDMMRSLVQQRMRVAEQTPSTAPVAPSTNASSESTGAPQYRKTEADEAYEREQEGSSHNASEPVPPNQHGSRGSQAGNSGGVDISKVFYYGKK